MEFIFFIWLENKGDLWIICIEYFWFIVIVKFNIYIFIDFVGESYEWLNRYDLWSKFELVSNNREGVENKLFIIFVGIDW